MRKLRYGILAVGFALIVAGAVQAQPYGYGMMGPGYGRGYGPGYGMMGGGYGPGYGMGPGMMGGGYGPGMMGMMGYGMMGRGMMGGYGPGYMIGSGMMGYGRGYGPGWMMRGGYGPGMMGYAPGYYGNQGNLNLTTDQVKAYLERMIRNPNLKVGDVKEKDADTIVAEIVTKDKSDLVQRLDFNRHNGFVQPEQ